MAEPQRTWTSEQLASDEVSKKDLVTWLHEHASNDFLVARKLNGQIKNVAKTQSKDALAAAYEALFAEKAFRAADEAPVAAAKKAASAAAPAETAAATAAASAPVEDEGPPKYAKAVLKKGDRVNFPKKNDMVSVWYKGMLEDGTVFDTNTEKKRGKRQLQPLKFKVGTGRVIRGWDEALVTMSKGEKAKLTIEPEWAYGKKGMPDAGIGPNQRLIFEVELIGFE
ncbi:hypothetical protein THASP1DRAFT_27061 [Thamnocephalis sphaerospora]|uniref:peptidylprolyl isomerase n=1 Tax=Thamnocephalis sphaerospora TaxID=78915 RepID=A0A4P9XXT8_9FUNG|nr:hypothetical protein THASP1DRAFT_27061 [Thamnocephalis sphaerospora]|eukprot:RKP11144.1 hypothetical protein THASP1DRAFT_27061 [Thamnocephalis sphaerospora]